MYGCHGPRKVLKVYKPEKGKKIYKETAKKTTESTTKMDCPGNTFFSRGKSPVVSMQCNAYMCSLGLTFEELPYIFKATFL